MSRFDYVQYDPMAQHKQARLKAAAQKFEAAMVECDKAQEEYRSLIAEILPVSDESERADDKALAAGTPAECFILLEESYMWTGKAIRDEQIERNGSAPLHEQRGD